MKLVTKKLESLLKEDPSSYPYSSLEKYIEEVVEDLIRRAFYIGRHKRYADFESYYKALKTIKHAKSSKIS